MSMSDVDCTNQPRVALIQLDTTLLKEAIHTHAFERDRVAEEARTRQQQLDGHKAFLHELLSSPELFQLLGTLKHGLTICKFVQDSEGEMQYLYLDIPERTESMERYYPWAIGKLSLCIGSHHAPITAESIQSGESDQQIEWMFQPNRIVDPLTPDSPRKFVDPTHTLTEEQIISAVNTETAKMVARLKRT